MMLPYVVQETETFLCSANIKGGKPGFFIEIAKFNTSAFLTYYVDYIRSNKYIVKDRFMKLVVYAKLRNGFSLSNFV